MAKEALRCPNCGSDFISAKLYWKPPKQMKYGIIDLYICGDCMAKIDPVTKELLPDDWTPQLYLEKKSSQVSLFGNKVSKTDYVYEHWRPCIVRRFDGTWINGGYKMDDNQSKLFWKTLSKMLKELYKYAKKVEVPDWHKYKKSKYRPNEMEHIQLVGAQIGQTKEDQWAYLDLHYSDKPGVTITDTGYFYVVSWKKNGV